MSATIKENFSVVREEQFLGLPPDMLESCRRFIALDERCAQTIQWLHPIVEPYFDAVVDAFYTNLSQWPEMMGVLQQSGSSMERLKRAQKIYLDDLFKGHYDQAYLQRRVGLGIRHNRVNLSPRWYLGGYSVMREVITPLIVNAFQGDPEGCVDALTALDKAFSLDQQIVMETYVSQYTEALRERQSSLQRSIDNYVSILQKIATGDLREKVSLDEDDGVYLIGKSVNEMIDKLTELATETSSVASSMASSLEEVTAAVSAQNSGASEQASAVTQTSTTLEEMRATSDQTLEKAQFLGDAAERTRREGEQGLETIRMVVAGMENIRDAVDGIAKTILSLSEKTQQIGEITQVVSSLAQQSKMLALNASIEAAKAGDAGRGFSVVATEVRSLAEQSQQSTEQVQKILQDIRHATDKAVMATEEGTKGVTKGLESVHSAGEVINALNDVILDSAKHSQQIVAAVRQEASGINQVANAMNEIHAVTGQFLSSSVQTQKAAEDLTTLAMRLKELTAIYKFEAGTGAK